MVETQSKGWRALLWPPTDDERYRRGMIWMGCSTALFYAAHWGSDGNALEILKCYECKTL